MKASAQALKDNVYYYFVKVPHPGYFSDFTEFENEIKGSTMDYDCRLGRKIKEELWARTGRIHPEEVAESPADQDYAKIKNLKYDEKFDTIKEVIHFLVVEHENDSKEVPA